ncbi:MAG: UbiA family prenyltransferase [Planctomycetota bacterium]|jgi:geranylgeranylglycerol-phosphate geranylgeranyltransferase
MSAGAYWRLARPFTLLAPAVGMVSGSLVALGVRREEVESVADYAPEILLGAAMAAVLNASSNAVNQIFDRKIDAVNKPERPLPRGEISLRGAWIYTLLTAAIALAMASALPWPTLPIVAFTAAVVYSYSGPPLRTKRFWWAANPTIAIPRGSLLFLAGWSAVRGMDGLLGMFPLVIAAMYGLFIMGAATTKDYADIEGDKAEGCITLPIRFGIKRSIWITAPFLVIPWLVLPYGIFAHGGFDTVEGKFHAGLGIGLALWGAYVVKLLLRDPEQLTSSSTHPSWQHMYLMMVGSQVGLAAGFWLPA